MHVLQKGRQFLLHMWNQSCYSCKTSIWMYHNFIRSPLVTCADMVWLLYIINVYIIMPYKKTEIAWRIWIHQICFESSVFLIF
jgi:hypothetical protein